MMMNHRLKAYASVELSMVPSFTAINARPTRNIYIKGSQHKERTSKASEGMVVEQCATGTSQILHNETEKWTAYHSFDHQARTVSD
jgi:hypothetical protein